MNGFLKSKVLQKKANQQCLQVPNLFDKYSFSTWNIERDFELIDAKFSDSDRVLGIAN